MNERFARVGVIARVDLAHEPDFTLGSLRVRPAQRELSGEGWSESLEPRVMRLLVALARAKGEILSRDDLIESCWDGVIVGEDAINRCISRLRKAAEASGKTFAIETIPRVGYRLSNREEAAPGADAHPVSAAPRRAFYRGLRSLDEQDEAIFFGRDAPIALGLDALRRVRDGSAKSMVVILGASGAGKSSFLKAGLLAQLKRDEENFLVLPVIRPGRAALTGVHGLAASLSCDTSGINSAKDLADLFARLRRPLIQRFRSNTEDPGQSGNGRPHTIVIPIDQAEELFAADNIESGRALELLAAAVRADSDIVIIATIRSDAFERLQSEPRLADVVLLPFSLAPLPHGAYKEVIEGPARLAEPKLIIEPALTEQLLQDLAAGDALPLLAFTLERLWLRHRGGGTLTLAEYVEDLGGLQGAITGAVEAAFEVAGRDPALSHPRVLLENLARAAIIPSLVHLDDADGEPRRRVERLDALPEATLPLVRHLIDQRLLVIDWGTIDGIDTDTVEVAHEAILRQWPALKAWIAEEREALQALESVRAAAQEWNKQAAAGERGRSWLAHSGARLEETERLLAAAHFANALGTTEQIYLAACRARENAERERERKDIEREKKMIARTHRLQRNILVLIGAGVIVILFVGFGITELLKGIAVRSSDALAQLSEQAADSQNDEAAARFALAGLAGTDWPVFGYSGARAERALRTANLLSKRLVVLRGHDGGLTSVAYSPDGTRVVTASADGTARVWNAQTGAQITVLRGHGGPVFAAAYSPDGTRIVTASVDKTARIWDARNGAPIATLRGHNDVVSGAAYSPDGRHIVTASHDMTARIWDATTGAQGAVLLGHTGFILNIVYSPDGAHIVTAADDKTARVWDATTGAQIAILRGHDGAVWDAAYSPDGRRIVTASDDRTARIWDAYSGIQNVILRGHENAVYSAAFSPDGTKIVTASQDKTARIWDTATGSQIGILRGHDSFIFRAAFSPDGTRIVTASHDKTARIWDAQTKTQAMVLRGHNDAVSRAAFSPDGTRVVTACHDKTAAIWSAITGKQITVLHGNGAIVWSAAYSPDGRTIVTASEDKTARIWDANTGGQIAVLRGHDRTVYGAAYNRDGTRLVTASIDKTARVWDARTGVQVLVLRGHDDEINDAAYSPDGSHIVTASRDRTARIWDANTGALITLLTGHGDAVESAAYSPDGKRIVTASDDRTARIWDAQTGMQSMVLRGHDDVVSSAVFAPDGTRIVTASQDKTVRVWDAHTGAQIAVLRGHDGGVNSAAYSPDGARIVTASLDKTARIWEGPQIDSSLLSLSRKSLVARTCTVLLYPGLNHFSADELAAAPDLDPKLDDDACHPPPLWVRLRSLLFKAPFT